MSQLDGAGKTWKAYFQDLPYAGYRDYCYPAKCNGIPDSDAEYVAKHNVGSGDNGLAGIAAVPGGGLWAVGVSSGNGNFATLILYHP